MKKQSFKRFLKEKNIEQYEYDLVLFYESRIDGYNDNKRVAMVDGCKIAIINSKLQFAKLFFRFYQTHISRIDFFNIDDFKNDDLSNRAIFYF